MKPKTKNNDKEIMTWMIEGATQYRNHVLDIGSYAGHERTLNYIPKIECFENIIDFNSIVTKSAKRLYKNMRIK